MAAWCLAVLGALMFCSPAQAQTVSAASDPVGDPLGLIGTGLADAYARLGAPAEVFAYRGTESGQDDVVFYYPSHLYLFWYGNRVWQVRVDGRYGGLFMGLRMGWDREQVVAAVSRRFEEVEGSLVFFLRDASQRVDADGRGLGAFPLRLRVFFRDGKLSDVYLYRGDF